MLALTSVGGKQDVPRPERSLPRVRMGQEGNRRPGRRRKPPAGKPLGFGEDWGENRESTLIIPARSRARGPGAWRVDPWSPVSAS